MAIPSDQTAKVRKEIKSVLRGLLLCVKVKQTTQSSSSTVKEKRAYKFSMYLVDIRHICLSIYYSVIFQWRSKLHRLG